MPSATLKVIPAAGADTERTGTGGPLFRGTGDMDYLCGSCGAVLVEGFGPAQHVSVDNAVCSTCGATNAFPPELRS
jgi:hypothetical protein